MSQRLFSQKLHLSSLIGFWMRLRKYTLFLKFTSSSIYDIINPLNSIISIIFLLLIFLNYCLGVTHSEKSADIKEKLPFHEKIAPPGSLITIQCDTSHTGELEQLIWLRNDSEKSVIFKKGQFINVSIFL